MKRWRDRFPGRSFASVGGVDLHYVRRGPAKGPKVLLLHGMGDLHLTWMGVLPLLAAKGFDVIALDLKGCGYSEKPARSEYSTDALIEEIGGFLDALRIRRAAVVGVSYGGHLALRFAAQHPERVAALVACSALAYTDGMNVPVEAKLARLPGLKRIAHWFMTHRALMEAYRTWNFSGAWEGLAGRVAEHWQTLRLPGGRRAYMAMLQGVDERLVEAAAEEYETIRVPTLLLWGDADAWFPVAQGRRLSKAIRGARLVVMRGAAHLFMEEAPGDFVASAAPFLSRALRVASRARVEGRPAARARTRARTRTRARARAAAKASARPRARRNQ